MEEVTLDAETLLRITQEIVNELGFDCGIARVAPVASSTTWGIYFTDGHSSPLFNDFREYVGHRPSEGLIRERIRSYLVQQHGAKEGDR